MHPADLSIKEAGAALRKRQLTARSLVQAHLDRINERNPQIQAFVALCPDRAIAAAEQADAELSAGMDRGPLHGIPFAIKDLIDLAGLATRCGSHATRDIPAQTDAKIVTRLIARGAIPLGKLATYEFALTGPSFDGPFPPALNPHNQERITGGSSSGSAAAVAAGMLRIALGTDTGGSIRSPSAFCGVVGLKLPFGAAPMAGVFPLSTSLDHVGPIAATISEAALVADAIASLGAVDEIGQNISGLKIGYARDWFATDPATDPDLLAVLDRAAVALCAAGASVAPVSLPGYALAEAAGAVILHAEALELHLHRLQNNGKDYGRQARQSLLAGVGLNADDIAAASEFGQQVSDAFDEVFAGFDAVITATTLAAAPTFSGPPDEQSVWTPMRTLPFNLTGHPALSMPAGHSQGLPVGLQIIGGRDRTRTICRIGAALESLLI